ncbi:MAG: P-loop NTPase [Clostridiales bacterium]|nr:P-loop NTPase [Clostridiales bacterium]
MGKLIITASGKGGVGKSVFAANLGAAFGLRGLRVALIDMNFGLRNLDLYLGLQDHVVFDVGDVLDGVVPLEKALVRDKRFAALHLLAGTTCCREDDAADRAPERICELYGALSKRFDIVLVDGPSGIGRSLRFAAAGTDAAVIVTTPEQVSLRDADRVCKLLADQGVARRFCLINRLDQGRLETGLFPDVEQITGLLRIPLLGLIQEEPAICFAANQGEPIVLQPGNYVERNFVRIADRLTDFLT